ncbi:MAG: Protein of unknown function UPF0060, partial [uncultured Acetobacteraceae bacterium]
DVCSRLRRRGAGRDRRLLRRLGLGAERRFGMVAGAGDGEPGPLRVVADLGGSRRGRARLRGLRRRLHRGVAGLAVGGRGPGADALGPRRGGALPARRGRHPGGSAAL